MRTCVLLARTLACAVLLGCGAATQSDGGVADLSIPAGNPDLLTPLGSDGGPPDLVYLPPVDASGFACGAATCAPGQECCFSGDPDGGPNLQTACMATCPLQRAMQFACDGPGNCGGKPCCLLIGQTLHDALCGAADDSCAPLADLPNAKITTRLCHVSGDCTAGGVATDLTQCCAVTQQGQTYHLCLSSAVASKVGGNIVCP